MKSELDQINRYEKNSIPFGWNTIPSGRSGWYCSSSNAIKPGGCSRRESDQVTHPFAANLTNDLLLSCPSLLELTDLQSPVSGPTEFQIKNAPLLISRLLHFACSSTTHLTSKVP